MGGCEKSWDPKAVAVFAADPSWYILLCRVKAQVLSHPGCRGTPATQPVPGTPASGEGKDLTCSCRLCWQEGAPGGLRGSLLGTATTFLTPHQLGILASHLGASSRAARACDSPRSRGGFGCLPRWRAQPSVAEPLWALPAPAGAGSESGDKRACVRLPAAGPAERPPAQLNCALFPCGRGARQGR